MPDAAPAHRLGPHVVGTRVVVRRVVRGGGASGDEPETGPTGGPAFTDLLGTCTAWGAETCTIAPERGEPVEIALRDIVSGKPVPPRASVRQRVSAREAEGHSFSAFPDVERRDLGDWVARSDPMPVGRPFKRANSCLAVGDPGVPVAEALTRVEAFYAERDRPALLQVEADGPVEAAALAAGWGLLPHGEVEFRLGSLAAVRRRRRGLAPAVDRTHVEVTGDRALAVVATSAGRIAEGRAILDGDWLGLHALKVRLEHRRQGLAGEVMDALLEWGAERGASTVWLHVETDNEPALALYDGLGLLPHHLTRYLLPPGVAAWPGDGSTGGGPGGGT
ncbi:GNAT family N-acetyltransferase [Nocardioides sp. Leaf307]|uniref:GNAT family N-acetyltransferase n=1 Tax=Nocardioides sp. Leaf307 TaxID=1736331 RepID=UPI0007029188|nr:GNAT family N-acetyltransferase [Nocardioides sp. Leaf307]KQQ41774.1 hypothetical protein ASF50_12735 [Nocardioides sp. Leaf307]